MQVSFYNIINKIIEKYYTSFNTNFKFVAITLVYNKIKHKTVTNINKK